MKLKNKQIIITDNLDLNNYKLINLSDPTNPTDATNKAYVDVISLLSGGTITGDLTVNGDIYVSGITTTIDVDNLNINDNIILLNSGETNAGVSLGTAGIEIDRGTSTNVQFIFDESTDKFKVGEIGSLENIATEDWVTSNSSGLTLNATNKQIIYNDNGALGGFGEYDSVNEKIIFGDNSNVINFYLDTNQNFLEIGSTTYSNTINSYAYGAVIGYSNTITGNFSLTIGDENRNGSYNLIVGHDNSSQGTYNMLFGEENIVSTNYNLVTGKQNEVYDDYNIVGGFGNYASSDFGFVVGANSQSRGNHAFAMGEYTQSYGNNSFAVGKGRPLNKYLSARVDNSFVISTRTIDTTYAGEAWAQYGGLLGGKNGYIPGTSEGSVLISADGHSAPASTTYTVFGPKFYSLEPGSGITMLSSNSTPYELTIDNTGDLLINGTTINNSAFIKNDAVDNMEFTSGTWTYDTGSANNHGLMIHNTNNAVIGGAQLKLRAFDFNATIAAVQKIGNNDGKFIIGVDDATEAIRIDYGTSGTTVFSTTPYVNTDIIATQEWVTSQNYLTSVAKTDVTQYTYTYDDLGLPDNTLQEVLTANNVANTSIDITNANALNVGNQVGIISAGDPGVINIYNSGLSQIRILSSTYSNARWSLGTGCSSTLSTDNFFIHRVGSNVNTTFEIDDAGDAYLVGNKIATQAWSTFSNIGGNPSDVITAGTNLSWSTNTLNVDDVFIKNDTPDNLIFSNSNRWQFESSNQNTFGLMIHNTSTVSEDIGANLKLRANDFNAIIAAERDSSKSNAGRLIFGVDGVTNALSISTSNSGRATFATLPYVNTSPLVLESDVVTRNRVSTSATYITLGTPHDRIDVDFDGKNQAYVYGTVSGSIDISHDYAIRLLNDSNAEEFFIFVYTNDVGISYTDPANYLSNEKLASNMALTQYDHHIIHGKKNGTYWLIYISDPMD